MRISAGCAENRESNLRIPEEITSTAIYSLPCSTLRLCSLAGTKAGRKRELAAPHTSGRRRHSK
jgi:hypothetical protein